MRRSTIGLLLLLIVPTTAAACLWDYDTLAQENARFPDTLELIVGKFPRHSPAYYEWRIKDREAKLEQSPDDLKLYDDIAVAYDKLGKHAEAIAWGEKTLAKQPERYETLANLGTFHFHAKQFDKGIPYIEKALTINPDAHFGRERYQLWLVEYVISRQKDGKTVLPLAKAYDAETFADFVRVKLIGMERRSLTVEERQAAVKGILGMMRFGKHDSPILLEALATLLSNDFDSKDAKQLAARAYIAAARQCPEMAIAGEYYARAKNVLNMQTVGPGSTKELPFGELSNQFEIELQDALVYSQQIFEREQACLNEGRDPDELFAQLLNAKPIALPVPPPTAMTNPVPSSLFTGWALYGLASFALLIFLALGGFVWLSGRRGDA